MFLVLGEYTSGLFTKTSKLGVLSNHIHEPRKPAPLGAIIKSTEEHESVIIVCDEVIQNTE